MTLESIFPGPAPGRGAELSKESSLPISDLLASSHLVIVLRGAAGLAKAFSLDTRGRGR